MTAEYKVHGSVAVITMANPPVNGLGLATRQGIVDGLSRANADAAVTSIVITGAGGAFSGGADIKEFGTDKSLQEPNLLSVIAAIENSAKPVVAAMHSVAMGGGLELALGCHYRIAAPGCSIALPEVKLGLIPGAGGTQRLPRVIGVEAALNLIVSGEPVKSEMIAGVPGQKLFDKMAASAESLATEALAFAQSVADARPLPLVRNFPCKHPEGDAYFQFARNMVKGMAKNFPAPAKCVDAVEAATKKKFAEGMLVEREIFINLMWTAESRALRHLFMAERAASKIPDVPSDTPKRDIKLVGVIGAGTMGGGISMNFLNAGIPVKILEMKQEALDRGVATIKKNYEAQVKKGKLKQDKYEQRMALLSTTLSYDDFKDCDLIIEAVFEEMGVKEAVFKQLDAVAKPGAILASNTSTLDVDKIAAFTKRPQDVVGMHFFSPANVMKLLEVVRGKETAKDVLATVMAIGKKIKKTSVVSGVCDGFIGNRMIEQYSRQAGFLLDEGCNAAAGGQGRGKVRLCHGPFPHGRPGRQRHWLGHPQAPRRRTRRHEVQPHGRQVVRTGPLRPEDRRRLVRLPGRQARRDPERPGRQDDRGPPQGAGHHAAQDFGRRNRAAPGVRPGQRRRAHPGRRHCQQVRRHRHGLPHRLRLSHPPWRPYALRQRSGPVQRGAGHGPLCQEPAGRRRVLEARSAAGQAGR